MRTITLFVIFLLSAGVAMAVPVKITANGEAYGSHGACEGWNSCGSAQGCAEAACKANGFNTVVSYGNELPCTSFTNCNLLDMNTGNATCGYVNDNCAVMGVTDIWCDNGNWTGKCDTVLPAQSTGHKNNLVTNTVATTAEIPEFGVIAGVVALIGALAIFAFKRK